MIDDAQQTPPGGAWPPQSTGLTIPDDVAATFGPLIELIKGSESMNDEERQYWINILPIMTPDQLKNLEEILRSEKEQLAAIDEKYSKEVASLGQKKAIEEMDTARRQKRSQRTQSEKQAAAEEGKSEEEILEEIQEL